MITRYFVEHVTWKSVTQPDRIEQCYISTYLVPGKKPKPSKVIRKILNTTPNINYQSRIVERDWNLIMSNYSK